MNKYYNTKSHKNGGLNIDANGNPTKKYPVANIEKQEVINREGNKLYVLSDNLKTNQIAMQTKKIKGQGPIAKYTRNLINNTAKRKNEELLQQLEESKESMIPTKIAGGAVMPLITQGLPIVTNIMKELFTKKEANPLVEPNANASLYGNKLFKQNGGNVKKYPNGGLIGLSALQNIPGATMTELLPTGQDSGINPLNSLAQIVNPLNKGLSNVAGVLSAAKAITPQFDNKSGIAPITNPDPLSDKKQMKLTDLMHLGSGIGSAIMALQRPERENLVQANYGSGDRLVGGTGIDYRAITNRNQNAFESGNEVARRASTSVGQYLNRMRGNSSQLADANSQAILGTKQYNDQIALQRAGREDNKAVSIQQEQIRKNIADSQNQAMTQDQVQNLFNQVTNIASGLDRKRYLTEQLKNTDKNNQRQLLLNLATLASSNPNFKPGNIKYILDNIDNLSTEEIVENLIQFEE